MGDSTGILATFECRAIALRDHPKSIRRESIISSTSSYRGLTVWLTGLSSSGKTTLSNALFHKLDSLGYRTEQLDGDIVRQQLSKGLGFSREDRTENIRRIGFVAEMLTRHGVIVLVSAISPYASIRDEQRKHIEQFIEVFVNAPLEVCERRDRKGIYRRARAGELSHVTGIDDPYEAPVAAEVECRTDLETVDESVEKVLRVLLYRIAEK